MRLRIGPVSIVRYAQNFDKNLLLAGVCKSNEWQKMIVDKGAHHACSNPTEAIDWIVSEICKRE